MLFHETLAAALPRGYEALIYYNDAISAQANPFSHCREMIRLGADPQAHAYLPAFGMMLEPKQTPPDQAKKYKLPPHYHGWNSEWYVRSVWNQLKYALKQAVQSFPQADATLVESLPIAVLEATYTDALQKIAAAQRATFATDDTSRAILLAAALAAVAPGIPWTLADDGEALIRTLPAHPLRRPAQTTPLHAFYGPSDRRTRVTCLAWALLPAYHEFIPNSPQQELLFFSGVGYQKVLRGLWAAMMDRKRSLLDLPLVTQPNVHAEPRIEATSARRLEGKRRYQSFWNDRPLSTSGLAHLVIEANEVCQPTNGKPFAHIVGTDGTPNYAQFACQLALALRVPFKHEWVRELWELGRTADPDTKQPQLITTLPSYGCTTFWVRADLDAAWGAIVAKLAGATFSARSGGIETIGTLHQTITTVPVLDDSGEVEEELLLAA